MYVILYLNHWVNNDNINGFAMMIWSNSMWIITEMKCKCTYADPAYVTNARKFMITNTTASIVRETNVQSWQSSAIRVFNKNRKIICYSPLIGLERHRSKKERLHKCNQTRPISPVSWPPSPKPNNKLYATQNVDMRPYLHPRILSVTVHQLTFRAQEALHAASQSLECGAGPPHILIIGRGKRCNAGKVAMRWSSRGKCGSYRNHNPEMPHTERYQHADLFLWSILSYVHISTQMHKGTHTPTYTQHMTHKLGPLETKTSADRRFHLGWPHRCRADDPSLRSWRPVTRPVASFPAPVLPVHPLRMHSTTLTTVRV